MGYDLRKKPDIFLVSSVVSRGEYCLKIGIFDYSWHNDNVVNPTINFYWGWFTSGFTTLLHIYCWNIGHLDFSLMIGESQLLLKRLILNVVGGNLKHQASLLILGAFERGKQIVMLLGSPICERNMREHIPFFLIKIYMYPIVVVIILVASPFG